MTAQTLPSRALKRRAYWVAEIKKLSGRFGDDTERMDQELRQEVADEGVLALLDHLRTCGAIPEAYGHDSSEEKLYSKYTDSLIAVAFASIGVKCVVLKERADSADVEGVALNLSFVADAKAFRLSRTAKNQKDFKVQAMDTWKRGKSFAILVCPSYQLPLRSSQIYRQAIVHNVCILTYSHVAMLVAHAALRKSRTVAVLHAVLKCVAELMPSKEAPAYWAHVNRTMLSSDKKFDELWAEEKLVAVASLKAAKDEALETLAREREQIMKMSHQEAVSALISRSRLVNRAQVINGIIDNGLLDVL